MNKFILVGSGGCHTCEEAKKSLRELCKEREISYEYHVLDSCPGAVMNVIRESRVFRAPVLLTELEGEYHILSIGEEVLSYIRNYEKE